MENEVDLFRDTYVRYLGYANEVGESFRHIIGARWVNCTYGIASLYVVSDTLHKSRAAYKNHIDDLNHIKKVAYATVDTLTWQFLASVIIPGFTINRICAVSYYLLQQTDRFPKNVRKYLVTGIGLTSIPFIIKPIDKLTDILLDETLRKYAP